MLATGCSRLFAVPGGLVRALIDELMPSHDRSVEDEIARLRWTADRPEAYCPRCGTTVGPHGASARGCHRCTGHRPPWDRVVRLSAYRAPISHWIAGAKYRRQWTVAARLGRELAGVMSPPIDARHTVVCPAPMHWRRRLEHGYNHAQLIATALAETHRLPCVSLLHRVRHRPPQVHLTATQRRQNIRGCMTADAVDLSGHDLWLVDDVKTTGATMTAAARLLRRLGARSITVAVLAVADPRGGDFKAL